MICVRKKINLMLMGLLTMSLFFTSCEKEPSFSSIEVCVDFPSGENECGSDVSTFQTTDPTISVSCELANASIEDDISFGLYFNNNGSLLEIATFRERIEDLTDGEDGKKLKAFAKFTKPSNLIWDPGEWEIQVDLESETPISITKKFTVVQ